MKTQETEGRKTNHSFDQRFDNSLSTKTGSINRLQILWLSIYRFSVHLHVCAWKNTDMVPGAHST